MPALSLFDGHEHESPDRERTIQASRARRSYGSQSIS
jgi:hypothetical protein